MNSLNSVLLEGNMIRDPLIRETEKGTKVCQLSIASSCYTKEDGGEIGKEVCFFIVEAWGKLAEEAGAKGKKGRGIRVVGRLKQDRWTGTDGKNRERVSIVAEHIEYRPE